MNPHRPRFEVGWISREPEMRVLMHIPPGLPRLLLLMENRFAPSCFVLNGECVILSNARVGSRFSMHAFRPSSLLSEWVLCAHSV